MTQSRRPYTWLQVLMVVMAVVAAALGTRALHDIEARLVIAAGKSLSMAAGEIANKLDRLMFERYGDVRTVSRAFVSRMSNRTYLHSYLAWMKQSYSPVYLWLGVTDRQGRVIAATDPHTVGLDLGTSDWFQTARRTGKVHVGDVQPYIVSGGMDAVAHPVLRGRVLQHLVQRRLERHEDRAELRRELLHDLLPLDELLDPFLSRRHVSSPRCGA